MLTFKTLCVLTARIRSVLFTAITFANSVHFPQLARLCINWLFHSVVPCLSFTEVIVLWRNIQKFCVYFPTLLSGLLPRFSLVIWVLLTTEFKLPGAIYPLSRVRCSKFRNTLGSIFTPSDPSAYPAYWRSVLNRIREGDTNTQGLGGNNRGECCNRREGGGERMLQARSPNTFAPAGATGLSKRRERSECG